MAEKSIPQLASNPLAVTEVVGADDLSATERAFLHEREKIVERGSRVFVEVGMALAEIRDYNGGVLYKKRYGSFEAYCKERWDFGRIYGHRLIQAANIVQELKVLPRGNTLEKPILPTSEKQVRELVRLQSPEQRREAWKLAVKTAGDNPIRASDVRKTVNAVMKEKGIKPQQRKRKTKETFLRIKASDVAKIRERLETLRAKISKLAGGQKLQRLITEIEELIPK